MNYRHIAGLWMLAFSFVITGCVSTGKYKKLETSKNDEITSKNSEISNLNQRVSTLEKEKADLAQEKEAMAKANQDAKAQYDELVNHLADEVQKGDLKVTQYKNMMSVDVAEQIFFASGSAVLKQGGKDVLKKVANALKSYPNKIIRVAGHTDNVPLAKAIQSTYPSNWELSVIRATNVVRFLEQAGIEPQRLIATGRGEYAPIAANDTPEGRQKNRRIEIMLIDKALVDQMEKQK
jgi:chemotaxis protein MotB